MAGRIPATIIILAKNEEESIERVVYSCAKFQDVVVVDSASTDQTVDLAIGAGARIIQFEWDGAYPKKKEWGASHPSVTTDWVVHLDADEELPDRLVEELESIIGSGSFDAIDVPLAYVWQGRLLRHGHKVYKRIAYRRSAATWPRPDDLGVKNMWEVEGHYQPTIRGLPKRTEAMMTHEDTGSLFDYFLRQNRYTDWEAWVLEAKDKDAIETRSPQGKLAARLPFKPLIFFCYAYFSRFGYRDGRAGFDYAVAHSVYYWQVGLKRRELRRIRSGSVLHKSGSRG